MNLPIKNWSKTRFLVTTVGLSLFLVVATKGALAKYTSGGTNFLETYKQSLEVEGWNLPQWGLSNLNYIGGGLTKLLIGAPTLTGEQTNSGAAGVFAGLIDNIYQNPPASSRQYFADLGNKIGIVKPAYAQGEGWTFLSPILELWKACRNIAYLLFVIAFVAMGFMIMLRKKIDSQTVVSIQLALPKIIVSLILVTFSFAICGLMVDLVYLGNQLMLEAFNDVFVKICGAKCTWLWQTNFYPITYAGIIIRVKNIIDPLITGITMLLSLVTVVKGDFVGIFNLVIAFTVVSSVIKIFFVLLGKYVTIIISTIFSPFIFLWSTFPGQEEHKSKFIKSFLSAVLVFPALMLILNLAAFISIAGTAQAINLKELPPFTTEWVGPPPPGIAPPALPAVPQTAAIVVLAQFVALGILMTASRIGEIIDDALAVKAAGPALGAEAAGALRRIPIIGSFLG